MKDENKKLTQLFQQLEKMGQQIANLEAIQTAEQNQVRRMLDDSSTQIERAKQEWEITVDTLPQLVCLLDRQGRIMRANRMVERWQLAPVFEVEGVPVSELLRSDSPDSADDLKTFLDRAWTELAQGRSAEAEVEDRQLQRHFQIQLYPCSSSTSWQNKAGNSFAVLMIHDITDRRWTQRESEENDPARLRQQD